MDLTLKVKKATLLQRIGHMDVIYIDLDEDTSQKVHGENLKFHGCAGLKMEVAQARGVEAMKALGITGFDTIKV